MKKILDEPANSNAFPKALVIVFGVTSCQRHLLRTRTKGLLSRTRVMDFRQRRLSANHVNDSLCYATLRDTALWNATLR